MIDNLLSRTDLLVSKVGFVNKLIEHTVGKFVPTITAAATECTDTQCDCIPNPNGDQIWYLYPEPQGGMSCRCYVNYPGQHPC